MSQRKLLSVLLSNYNHAHYLEGSLEPITNQSYSPVEFIIIDDASTDNSTEIIGRFASSHPHIKFIKNEKNLGLLPNQNKLLDISQGDYIHGASSDDSVLLGFYEKTMDMMSQYPQAGVCWVDAIFIDEVGRKIGEERSRLSEKPCYFSPDEVVNILRKKMFHISGFSTIYKRSAFIEAGGFIPELKSYSDFFPILVMAFRYGVCYIPETLVACRFQKTQYSAKLFKDKKAHAEIVDHMLTLLNSPSYADVRPSFKKSLALAYLFSPGLKIIAADPAYRYFLSRELVSRTLWRTIKKKLNPYLPLSLKNIYYYIRNMHNKYLFGRGGK